MWKGMVDAGGLVAYLQSWFAGKVPSDAMMEPMLAANQVIRALTGKLDQPVAAQQLDLCVSHDITLHLVRDRLLGEAVDSSPVAYLDALVLFRLGDELRLASQRGSEVLLQEG